jgi:PAS domain S-box-containing protein
MLAPSAIRVPDRTVRCHPRTLQVVVTAERANRSVFYDLDFETDELAWSGLDEELGEQVQARSYEDWLARVHPDDRPTIRLALDELRTGRSIRSDLRYRVQSTDGWILVLDRVVVVEHEGHPWRLLGTLRRLDRATPDDHKSLADQLRLSEHRFETFVDGLPQLAWECDADGWIDYYNQSWYRYTGTTLEEMEGWGWARVHDPLALPRMLRVFRNALAAGTPWEDEFRLRRADGELRWHLSRAAPLRDTDGRIVRWFGTNTDIQDQRNALEERERLFQREQVARRSAEAANREKDEFLAVVSHELRTPLSAIQMRVHLLRERSDASHLEAELVKVDRSTRQLGRLIEDLLDVSRILAGKLELDTSIVDLADPVQAAVEALRPAADRIDVTVTGTTVVRGSADRLQQIASNLLSNAIKFAPKGRIGVNLTGESGRVKLTVVDEGDGIAPDLLPTLFERFRQGDGSRRRKHGGLGLGLSIVRTLTELHGGTVTATSDGDGAGATFTVLLPAADSPLPTSPTPQVVRPVSLSGIRVLGIDDDPDAREVLAMALLASRATVTVAGSAAEAFERLRSEIPDVIVSDLAMPEIDGFALIERVRSSSDERLRSLPVIALTAHASSQDRADALSRGFTSYLSKPYDAGSLCRLIAEVVARRSIP